MNVSLLLNSYKNRIALIIFFSFLPFFALDFYKNWNARQSAKDRVVEKTVLYVDTLAKAHETMLFSAQKEMTLLSKIEAIKEARNPECRELLREFKALSSAYVNLGVANAQGELICSLMPLQKVSQEAMAVMKKAQKEGRFVSGDAVVSSNHQRPIIPFALPLEPAKGEDSWVLMGGGSLEWFNERSMRQNLSEHSSLYIVDSKESVIGVYPYDATLLGKPLGEKGNWESLKRGVLSEGIGWLEGRSSKGDRLILFLENSQGLEIIAILDAKAIELEASRFFWQSFGFLVAMILVAFGLAAFTAKELILKEVNALFRLTISQSKYTATSELLSSIAHQWRQPLNGLGLQIALLKDSLESGSGNAKEWLGYLNSMERSIHSLSETISKFSSFFKKERTKERFMLQEAIREAFSFLENSLLAGKIQKEIRGEEIVLMQHKKELIQNLLSLFQNSIEAFEGIQEGSGPKRIEVETRRLKQKALIIIRDNAGGIDEEMVEKIFQPYSTTKFQGEGVGLSLFMVKSILEREMGGSIHARNIAGGAEFTLELPAL
ncbi:ATP-binding protein [Wolinella succinogenes]|uniref:ATP-binding protein n=1 Tax=Wolinella succinogenes TaxID=844 RepID=UPI002FC798E6